MHPALARYLSIEAAIDTLSRDEAGQVLRAEERPFAEVARAHPDQRARVLGARGRYPPSSEVQEALLFLAAHTAAIALREDEGLGPKLQVARAALSAEGASEAEVDHLIVTLVLEEAFGYEDAAEEFDRPFFEETVDAVPALATLTRVRVQQLEDAFARTADEGWRHPHRLAAEALFEAAWSEGPEPVNPEHVQLALEALKKHLSIADQPRGPVSMKRFLTFLHQQGLVGPARLARLLGAVDRVSGAPAGTTLN